jgi:hypothetical protein
VVLRKYRLFIALTALGLVIAGCTTTHHHAAAPTSTTQPFGGTVPRSTTTTLPIIPVTSLKPAMTGLLDRNGLPPAAYAPDLGGFVINVNWSALQPNGPGTPIVTTNIDNALAAMDALNASTGAHLYAKLRLFIGINSPAWAKTVGGASFPDTDPASNVGGTVPRFWTTAFGTDYNSMMKQLAAKYDTDPRVRNVTMSRCTTVYSEPMQRQISSPSDVSGLVAAGFTSAQDLACYEGMVQEALRDWPYTHLSFSFNPYQQINSAASTTTSDTVTDQMIDYCRQVLGSRCTLENNSLRSTSLGGLYDSMYAAIKAKGAPITYQTATLARVGSLPATLQVAINDGAIAVELPSGYETVLTPTDALSWTQRLAANGSSA